MDNCVLLKHITLKSTLDFHCFEVLFLLTHKHSELWTNCHNSCKYYAAEILEAIHIYWYMD